MPQSIGAPLIVSEDAIETLASGTWAAAEEGSCFCAGALRAHPESMTLVVQKTAAKKAAKGRSSPFDL